CTHVIVDEDVCPILLVLAGNLLGYQGTITADSVASFFKQCSRLLGGEMMQKEEAHIDIVWTRLIGTQRFAQELEKVLATCFSDMIAGALAQRNLFMSQPGAGSLNGFAAHLKIAVCYEPVELVIDSWFLDKLCKGVMVELDDLANLLAIHGSLQQQSKHH